MGLFFSISGGGVGYEEVYCRFYPDFPVFRENNAIYDGRLSKSFKNLQNGQRQTADAGLNQIIIIQKKK
jgi:hypothetical protein